MRSLHPIIPPRLPEHFARSEVLSPLVAKAERLAKLQCALEGVVPLEMATSCRVANLRDGQVVVWVTGNAAAAKLKLLLPRLEDALSGVCADVQGVRLEVQFVTASTGRAPQPKRDMIAPLAAPLHALAESLPPSPLADAVRSLARKGR